MKLYTRIAIAITVLLAFTALAGAQSWSTLVNTVPSPSVGTMLQLRDGRVIVHQEFTGSPGDTNWFLLTPDAFGNYVNGTWSSAGNLPSTYGPEYFGAQVLLDGRTVVIEGGEYNFGSGVWTNMGARLTYSGSSFTWVSNAPPTGWANIGDAQSVTLADGRYMQASCCFGNSQQSAFYTGPNSWSPSGNIIGPANDEGAYTLLPNGKVIMVDAWSTACSSTSSTEMFDPTTNTWSCGPNTPFQMWDNSGHELGPAVLMHNGKVFQVGANPVSAIYNSATNSWTGGPSTQGLAGYDAPGALEFNGKVLEIMGPPSFGAGCQAMEYDPVANTLSATANPGACPGNPTYVNKLMVLPTGQIMTTSFSNLVHVYNPAGSVDPVAKPTILAASTNLTHGTANNLLYGKQLNGLSQASTYGDDYQGDVDFPLVTLTNVSTGHVYWCLTHNESTHSIAPGTVMFTQFDIPASVPAGTYALRSIAAGVSSNPITVAVH